MEPSAWRARFGGNGHALLLAVGICAAVLCGIAFYRELARPEPGQGIGPIVSFEMLDQRGRLVSDGTLRGQTLVVDFFFASCTTSCPMLTARMLSIENAIKARERQLGRKLPIHLVSITLDPENDTPDVLNQYATTFGADPDYWSFLSGRSADLDRVVVAGFKTTFRRADPSMGIATIMHGEWLVLVGPNGMIRGYYAAGDPERMVGLEQDLFAVGGA